MTVEFNFCAPDELTLGIFMAHGEDEEEKEFHCLTLGFLFCEVVFYKYQSKQN